MTFRKQYLLTLGWILFLMLLALLTPNPANAQIRVELGAGITAYGVRDGVWYDNDYAHFNQTRSDSKMIGIYVPLTVRYGLRADLVDLGGISNWAYWSDWEVPESRLHPRCDAGGLSGCNYGEGQGNVRGMSVGFVRNFQMHYITPFVEGGLFRYHGTWDETVQMHTGDTVVLHSEETHFSPYFGIGIRYGYLFATVRGYTSVRNGLADRVLRQTIVGLSFPFGGEK